MNFAPCYGYSSIQVLRPIEETCLVAKNGLENCIFVDLFAQSILNEKVNETIKELALRSGNIIINEGLPRCDYC